MRSIIDRGLALAAALGLGTMGIMLAAPAAQATDGADPTCTTETTGWVTEAPPGDGWVQIDERTVVDEDAYDETIIDSEAIPAQHYSYKGGPIAGTPSDLPPSDNWQANTTLEPHYQGGGVPASNPEGSDSVEGDSGLHYTSAGNSGLADWFYYQAAQPEQSHVVHHEAVTHQEFMFQKVSCGNDEPTTVGLHAGVKFLEATCSDDPSVKTLDVDGVKYEVKGTVAVGSTVTVTATAKDGFVLKGRSTWTHTFDLAPKTCEQEGADPASAVAAANHQPRAELPHTGATDSMALGAGALGLLSLGALLLRLARKPEGVTALG
jgi:LPXTG-motif cell wall-anchored protein